MSILGHMLLYRIWSVSYTHLDVYKRQDLDITNEKKVYDLFKNNNFDIVFHSAAISDTGRCQNEPEFANKINFDGTVNIAKGCALKDSKLIFASSDQLYAGNEEEGPYFENIIVKPDVYKRQDGRYPGIIW